MIFLILFSFFIATVLLAIVLERLLRSPALVGITIFAVYLIILAILFAVEVITDFATGLIGVIILAVIAFITAVIVRFLRCICNNVNNEDVLSVNNNCLCSENEANDYSNCNSLNIDPTKILDRRFSSYT